MNKQLLPEEIALLAKPVMSRRDKLMRFAEIVRKANQGFGLYHDLERWSAIQLNSHVVTGTGSAFGAAVADPILRDAGLTGDTVGDAKRFFELSQHELHEFSCDCGGAITNADMANRIESLAARS